MENQSNIILHDYNGHCIYQRETDAFVNLTRMGKIYGKQVSDWTRLASTKAYIQEVSIVTGFTRDQLLVIKQGGDPNEPQGTWGHRLIAISFAQWLNETFAVWCNQHLLELMDKGQVQITETYSNNSQLSFNDYLDKLINLKPMLEKDKKLAKQMLKHIYDNL